MSNLNLPNPCLSAIILTVSTHSGPQFVFHWPPVPGKADTGLLKTDTELFTDSDTDSSWSGEDSDEDKSSDSNEDAIDDSEDPTVARDAFRTVPEPQFRGMPGSLLERLERSRSHQQSGKKPDDMSDTTSDAASDLSSKRDQKSNLDGHDDVDAEKSGTTKVLGFETDFLSELLCPQKDMCNTKFEMAIDDAVFLGLPIHVYQGGFWRRKQQPRRNSPQSTQRNATSETPVGYSYYDTGEFEEEDEGEEHIPLKAEKEEANGEENGQAGNPGESPMHMFHVVFVMHPPITEFRWRVDQMYNFVLAKFVRTLRIEQAKSNYVWNEVSTMVKIRDEALATNMGVVDMCKSIVEQSTLGLAISQLFASVKSSEIASVDINTKMRSFQIPIDFQFSRLPPLSVPYLSGSYLRSQSDFETDTDEYNVYCAILLLDTPDRIIKDIGVDPYSPLASFIRTIEPTETIKSLADTSGVDVRQIIELMKSLVYWRRARPITPLNYRNTYTVSPLASIGQIYKYIPMFRDQFPALASLPRMLSMLSTGKPRQFASHIPSRDHRDVYLSALAFLVKHGFVMQLRTFVWLKIPKRVKTSVHRDMQVEEEKKEMNKPHDETAKKNTDTSTDNTSKQVEDQAGIYGTSASSSEASMRGVPLSRYQSGHSDGSEQAPFEDWREDSILLDPATGTMVQKKWIAKLAEDKPADVAALFLRLVKYFDGHSAVENFTLVENVTRQDVRRVNNAFDECIMLVRHW